MPVGKNKTRLAVTLESITAEQINELAKIEKRSVSAMLAILIAEALDSRKKVQHGFVRGANYYRSVMKNNINAEEIPDG